MCIRDRLRDRIVCVIVDEGLQNKLFSEPDLTFELAAAETAQKYIQDVRMLAENTISAVVRKQQNRLDH